MTAQDDTPSVDDDALASALQTNTGQGEEVQALPPLRRRTPGAKAASASLSIKSRWRMP